MSPPKEKSKLRLSNVWFEAKEIMWEHRKRLSLGLGLLLVNTGVGWVLPWAGGVFLGDVGQERYDRIQTLILAIVAATVVRAISSFFLTRILSVAAQRAIMDMRREVQRHVMRLPTHFFDETKSGVLISRIMTDPEGIRNLVGTGVTQLVGGLLTTLVAVVVLFVLNWKLTLVVLVVFAAFGAVMSYAFSKLRPLFRLRGEINADVTGRLTEALGGVRVVKAYTAEEREDEIFGDGVERLFQNVAATLTGVAGVGAFATVVVGAVGGIVIYMGGNALASGEMTLTHLGWYVGATAMMASPLINMANIGTQITEAFAGLDRIRELKRMTTELEEDATRDSIGDLRGDIEFKEVCFEYDEGVPVLKNVSLTAAAGSTTALVGPSGSGKSTLIGLVMAFHYPKSGQVLVDGKDLSTIKLNEYRSNLGVVMQDNFLFEGTIAENIRYSRPDATMEEIYEVGRIAHCEEFVEGFEKGYETIVGERGVKLSGGQRQRVAIARAILADPRILILDEATASLDSESEAKIQDGLNSLRAGRTTFVIAHRLSTIVSSDQILVLDGGEIVERGTHQELLALDGRYKQLYDKQYKFEMNRFINPGEELPMEMESA